MSRRPFENKAAVGRDVAILIALENTPEPPQDENFKELGAVRGLDYGPEWETVDTTARGTSSGFSRTSLVTYKNNSVSVDGLRLLDDETQDALNDHVEFPPASMNHQPQGWVRIVEPRTGGASRIIDIPILFTSMTNSAPYDAEWSWSAEWDSQGDPVITNVPAEEEEGGGG